MIHYTTCTIPGCDKPHCARGWCREHYTKLMKYGDPTTDRKMRYKTYGDWEEWFIKKYSRERLDYLLDSLFNNCQTLEAISQTFRVTRESVRLWRKRIRQFKPQFTSQRTQRKYCTLLKLPNRIAEAEKNFIPSPAIAYCIERAKAEGLDVSLVWSGERFLRWRLLINGQHFYVNQITHSYAYNPSLVYYHFGICLFDKGHIVCVFDGSTWAAFVFPQGILTKKYYFIPVDLDRAYNWGPCRAIDWKFYREAWHLLR